MRDENGRVLFRKRHWKYLFTVIIVLKNGKKLPFFKFADHRTEDILMELLDLLPDAPSYHADNAKIYRNCWVKKFVTGKSNTTNLVENFNSFLRSKNPYLARRSQSYAKNLHNFELKLIMNVQDFLKI